MAKIQSTSVTGKETLYVDIDDEITSIIDKVRGAKSKVVALVLPKRATVLQSIVNMKLLKRTADDAKKNLVLVTSEAGLMPLAGSVGLHVASTPSSKPAIPPAPAAFDDGPELIDEPLDVVDSTIPVDDEPDLSSAGDKPVGELAAASVPGKIAADDIDENIDLADDTEPAKPADKKEKPKKNKKLAVPNFDSFRKKLLLAGGVLVALIVLWILAFMVLPKATVTIHTDSSTVNTNLNLALDTTAKSLNTQNNIVPATAATEQKTASQQVPATGQQNNGQTASGTITVTNCTSDNSEVIIPAGKSISASGHTYTLNSGVDLQFSGQHGHGACQGTNGVSSATVGITALKGGSDYNVDSGTAFTVSTYSSTDVRITGSASGGTDNITKIVLQSDIDGATAKIKAQDATSVKQQLTTDLQTKGLQVVDTTFVAGDPQVSTSAKAGAAADNVTVTAITTYSMLGVKKTDLETLVDKSVNSQLDKGKQVILDDGIANAKYSQQNPASATGASVSMSTKSAVGPQIDTTALKKQIAGKKSGDIQSLIKQTPGVTSVDVKYSPFWVTSTPKSANKVTVLVDKPSTKQ